MQAYDDAITRSAAEYAPWHIVPANKKKFRNLAVAETLVEALGPYRDEWKESLSKLAESKLTELRAMRAADSNSESDD